MYVIGGREIRVDMREGKVERGEKRKKGERRRERRNDEKGEKT